MSRSTFSRRQMLKGMSLFGAGLATSALWRPGRRVLAQEGPGDADPRFLIVLCASGGASLLDSVMAIRESESANAATLNCFPDALVQDIADSPFRALDLEQSSLGSINLAFSTNQSDFVKKHHQDMMVATWTRTSVNHAVGQRRSVTGNEAWGGRTMQEVAALTHGQKLVLPNAHLVAGSGFSDRGGDGSLPSQCYGEVVPDPALWPLALDGSRGIAHPVERSLLERARKVRDQQLEPMSRFSQAFADSPALAHWRELRSTRREAIESAGLIEKLMIQTDNELPLSSNGLSSSPDAERVRAMFPDFAIDPFESQAALAFLLLKNRLSASVTLGPGFDAVVEDDLDLTGGGLPEGSVKNPPIGFDFSHQGHRSTQAFMWHRLLRVADGLIELLKSEEYGGGQSMWDRTLIYIASDFDRSKTRPSNADDFGSGHDLNGGALMISPLVRGNSVLGGVDPDTGLTYGFDPRTGDPEPGRHMTEAEIYAGVVQALGADTSGSGLPDMPAMRRSS